MNAPSISNTVFLKRYVFKSIYVAVVILLWFFGVFLVTELLFRLYVGGQCIAAVADEILYHDFQKQLDHDDIIYQEVRSSNEPPDNVNWNIPESAVFENYDDEERRDLAEKRREIIFICDEDGNIKKVYPCLISHELAMLSERIIPGATLASFLPAPLASDAIGALQEAQRKYLLFVPGHIKNYASKEIIRDYYIPLSDESSYAAEFRVLALSENPHSFAVFIGDSVYERMYETYRPNIYRRDWWWRKEFTHAELWTNSLGFRDREIVLPKPAGVVRIVCIGGSTTVEGPHNKLTYPKMLEAHLQKIFSSERIEVINCGVDGSAFNVEYERMQEYLALEPDLIVHYNVINNMCGWLIESTKESGMLTGKKGKIRQLASWSRLLVALRPEWFLPSEDAFGEQLGEAVDYLDKMRQAAADAGVAFAVASFATPDSSTLSWNERVYFDHSFSAYTLVRFSTADYNRYIGVYNRLVRKFCSDKNLLYIPVAENFSGGVDTFTDICHMRLRGIELKAQIMAEYLEDFVRERLEAQKSQEFSSEDDVETPL